MSEGKEKIAVYDLEGYLIDVFEVEKIIDLEEKLNIPQGGINSCLSGKALTTNFLQFKKVMYDKVITKIGDVSKISVGQSHKPVIKFYNDKYVATYDNITIASRLTGIDVTNISKACNGKQKKAGLFTWKYA